MYLYKRYKSERKKSSFLKLLIFELVPFELLTDCHKWNLGLHPVFLVIFRRKKSRATPRELSGNLRAIQRREIPEWNEDLREKRHSVATQNDG